MQIINLVSFDQNINGQSASYSSCIFANNGDLVAFMLASVKWCVHKHNQPKKDVLTALHTETAAFLTSF